MNTFTLKHSERGLRVTSHVESQPEDFPVGSKAASLSSQIKQELSKLAELDVTRSSSMSKRKQGTNARENARKQLLRLIRAVADTADVIALEHADIKGMFVRPQKNANDQTLVSDARSFAEKAASHVGLFTENGLYSTFIDDVRSYADSLEHSMQIQTESVGERVRTNAETTEIIRRLNDLIARLDVIVRNKHRDDPAKLAAWESACRLEHPSHSKRNGSNNAPLPAPPQ